MELSEFDIIFKTMVATKSKALADFVVKFANVLEMGKAIESVESSAWNLFMDGLAGDIGLRTRVVLMSQEGHKLNSTVRFRFKATNNVAEYETLLAGLRLAKEI